MAERRTTHGQILNDFGVGHNETESHRNSMVLVRGSDKLSLRNVNVLSDLCIDIKSLMS